MLIEEEKKKFSLMNKYNSSENKLASPGLPMSQSFFVFNSLRYKMIVRIFDIGGIFYYHSFNFLSIILIHESRTYYSS